MMNEELNKNITNNNEDNRKANILCIITLLLNFIPFFIPFILAGLLNHSNNSNDSTILIKIVALLIMVCPTVAINLMIYVRINYPKNIFGKILMILYIIVAIILIIGGTYIIVSCFNELSKCPG